MTDSIVKDLNNVVGFNNSSIENQIIQSIEKKNFDLFRSLVTQPFVKINYIFEDGLLHYLLHNYPNLSIDYYKFLLNLEICDINKSAKNLDLCPGELPVLCLDWKNKELLTLFLNNVYFNPYKLNQQGRNIIHKAIDENNIEIIEFLINHLGIEIKGIITDESLAPLNYAMDKNIDLFKKIISDERVNKNKSSIYVPIQYAIQKNNVEAFKILLDNGANFNLSFKPNGTDVLTLFEYILIAKRFEMIDYVLSKNENIMVFFDPMKIVKIIQLIPEIYYPKILDLNKWTLPQIEKLIPAADKKTFSYILDFYKNKRVPSKHLVSQRAIEIHDPIVFNKLLDVDGIKMNETLIIPIIKSLTSMDENDNRLLNKLLEYEKFDINEIINYIGNFEYSDEIISQNKVESILEKFILHDDLDGEEISIDILNYLINYPSLVRLVASSLKYHNLEYQYANGQDFFNSLVERYQISSRSIYSDRSKEDLHQSIIYILNEPAFYFDYAIYNYIDLCEELKDSPLLLCEFLNGFIIHNYTFSEPAKSEADQIHFILESMTMDQLKELIDLLLDKDSNLILRFVHYKLFNKLFKTLDKDETKRYFQNLSDHENVFLQKYADKLLFDMFINESDFIVQILPEIYKDTENTFNLTYLLTYENEKDDYDDDGNLVGHINELQEYVGYTDDNLESIRKILDFEFVNVQDSFYLALKHFPADIILKLIEHPSFQNDTMLNNYDNEEFYPIDGILYELNEDPYVDNEYNRKLVEVLQKYVALDKVKELNLLDLEGNSYIVNWVEKLEDKFDLSKDYLSPENFNVLAFGLQLILKSDKFTYEIQNNALFKDALIYCDNIYFITYLLSLPQIDYTEFSLHTVIKYRMDEKEKILKLLLGLSRIDINAKYEERTPLEVAIENNEEDICLFLIEQPLIDLSIKNRKGKNYLELATKHNLGTVIRKLEEKGLINTKKQQLERLESEYKQRMLDQGRILSTSIKGTLSIFEDIIKEKEDLEDGHTYYQKAICPFCLLYLEKEDPSQCVYMSHKCPVEIRNVELMKKYLGEQHIDESFEVCVSCGRPGLGHGHCSFDQPPEGRKLMPILNGGDHWVCNEFIGGGGRVEMIARIVSMLSYVKKKVDANEKIVYDKTLIKTLTDVSDQMLSSETDREAMITRAEEVLNKRKLDSSSKIPGYIKFNASNAELANMRREQMKLCNSNQKERVREPIRMIRNDGSLFCIVCMDALPILWQIHRDDQYYICSEDLQSYICGSPNKTHSCMLGCKPTKVIYKKDIEALDGGEFCTKNYKIENPLEIAVPTQELEDTIYRIKEARDHNGAGPSSYMDNGAGPSNLINNTAGPSSMTLPDLLGDIIEQVLEDNLDVYRKKKRREDLEEGEISEDED